MISQDDIDAFTGTFDVSALDYSVFVEGKILTEGKDRLVENVLGLVGEAGEIAEKVHKHIFVEGKEPTKAELKLLEYVHNLVIKAGKVAERIKKHIRDGATINEKEIKYELGDVVFYITAIANYFDTNLQEIININVDKLEDRASRGVLQGSGDNR